MEKITKKQFIEHAIQNGIALIASPWNKRLEEIEAALDKAQIDMVNIHRDRVTVTGQHIKRHYIKDGEEHTSNLRLDKDDICYLHGEFIVVFGQGDGWTNCIIYV